VTLNRLCADIVLMTVILASPAVAVAAQSASAPRALAEKSCDGFAGFKLPDATITAATLVPAGSFVANPAAPAGGRGGPPPTVPSFCRVQLTVAPQIHIEVWMPASGWNGKFEGVGGGGYAGTISYPAMVTALNAGYATASTDTGHTGNDPQFALGHPELVIDFGFRAIHEMTVKGKLITQTFYDMPPRESYFVGCSTGGRQGLAEAQRYPEDYDGIVSGAPAINWAHLMMGALWNSQVTLKDPESYIPAAKLAAINNASVAACDMTDGVKDALVADPRTCPFDPANLTCKYVESDNCLTPTQVLALTKVYDGARYPDGKAIYPGRPPGVERGWGNFTTGPAPGRAINFNYSGGYMKYFVLGDPNWDPMTFDFAKDMSKVDSDEKNRSALETMNPDLKKFRDRGGKLILYHGWGDDAVSPFNTINYYKMVVEKTSGGPKAGDAWSAEDATFNQAADKTGEFMRLFMVPGMNHCGGGPGPNTFDAATALANWVEKKQAPDTLLGSHMTNGAADLTRPLCPYPLTAKYSGSGSVTVAASFACK
jgi:feruloyl esterase